MGTYSTGMIDYTGGGGSSYDYPSEQDMTSSIASTNLNNAIQADKNMGLPSEDRDEDFYNGTSLFLASTTFAPAVVNGSSTMPQYPSDMLIVTAVCAFVIAILGTCGNLLTIIALPMSKKLRTTATAFVVNLAVVELLFCALILPMSGLQYMHLQRTRESLLTDNDCIFFTVTRYTLTQVELQTILAIALTRALAVSIPKMYTFLNKTSVIAGYITFIWLYSFVLRLPTALGYLGTYGFNPGTMECDMTSGDRVSRLVMIVVDALIPVIVILVLYVFVFIMVKRSSLRVARSTIKNSVKSVPPPTSSGGASTSSNSNNQRKGSNSSFKSLRARLTHQSSNVSQRLCTNRRDMRVARTIFIIFLVILICSVPVMLAHMFDRNVKYPVQFLALHILYWAQYCLNVVIYVLMNRQYRDAYVDCLARVFPQFKRHHGRKFFWEKASFSSKPPQNVPTSSRPRLDSADVAAADSVGSEPEPVATGNHPPPIGVQGRLSTIPEGHSSSAANDSVFSDPEKKEKLSENNIAQNSIAEDNPYYEDQKCFESDASDSEDEAAEKKGLMDDSEHWVTKNGSTGGNLPNDESKV